MRYMGILVALAATSAVLVACMPAPDVTGRALYLDHCAACHGPTGRGDGPAAAGLEPPVADLTRIAARNGGLFPMAQVISTIDGYTRIREGDAVMPEFGLQLQAGDLVMLDTGDGIPTRTPERLVALAAYLQTIQE